MAGSPPLPPQFPAVELSIIIPARNEESNLGACLESLTAQTDVALEIIVVDDDSSDRTCEIARSFSGVRVVTAAPRPDRWTGKNNAVVTGAKQTRAPWILFTDADTIHLPGSLARALNEAKNEHADLLSYSPEQTVSTFAERAVMPVIFAELAAQYPPHKVREQNSGVVAANGQYLLVRRDAYDAVGGHAAVATEILEDVALARQFRKAGYHIYFRYGADAVRARMYRSWSQLREGWTKNLALLFPHPSFLAFQSLVLWIVAWSCLALSATAAISRHFTWIVLAAPGLFLYRRIRPANFSIANSLIATAFGPPIFAYLLLRSKKAHANGQVSWKGRNYDVESESIRVSTPAAKPASSNRRQRLRTEN